MAKKKKLTPEEKREILIKCSTKLDNWLHLMQPIMSSVPLRDINDVSTELKLLSSRI